MDKDYDKPKTLYEYTEDELANSIDEVLEEYEKGYTCTIEEIIEFYKLKIRD